MAVVSMRTSTLDNPIGMHTCMLMISLGIVEKKKRGERCDEGAEIPVGAKPPCPSHITRAPRGVLAAFLTRSLKTH